MIVAASAKPIITQRMRESCWLLEPEGAAEPLSARGTEVDGGLALLATLSPHISGESKRVPAADGFATRA
jgi:hypothetical protein